MWKELDEAKKRQKKSKSESLAKVQEKLKAMDLCPMGYEWLPVSGGYRCAGGSHFVSLKDL